MSGKYSVKKYISGDAIANRIVIMDKIAEIQYAFHRDRIGGTIWLPSGIVEVDGEISIDSYGPTIKGEGPGSTLVKSVGESKNIFRFRPNSGMGGISDLSFEADRPKMAICEDDGDFTGLVNGGGCFSDFHNLTFRDGIHTGIRVGIRSNKNTYDNLQSFTENLMFMVHVNSDGADHPNDNATANIYTRFAGKTNIAGLLLTGGAHGDITASNFNLIGVNKGGYGIVFVGGDYYNVHVNICNVHFDGIGISGVAASQPMKDSGILNVTIGGAVTGKPINVSGAGVKWIDEDSYHL